MEKDKLKRVDVKFFLIPYVILLVVFAVLTFVTANNRIEESYNTLEKNTLNIADSYSHGLTNSTEAYEIITELLDEKLMIASQAIMLIEDKEDNETLSDLAEKFNVDDIFLYNKHGEITHSNVDQYIGWIAAKDHSVYEFMASDQVTLVEDIRADSESGIYYKYGYVKGGDGTFVQIGVLADRIHDFLGNFEITKLINDISSRGEDKHVFLINPQFEIVATSLPKYIGSVIEDEDIRERIRKSEPNVLRTVIDNNNVFQVCVPISSGNEKLGTLSIAWPTNEIEKQVKEIIINSILIFLIVIITIGYILYYAYRKNKSNIKIAYYDKLTGLPNSEYLVEYLEYAIKNLGKSKKAVMLLNCTNFKTLNMTYGFMYGDQIMKQVASKAKNLLDPEDMFFRFNADRFVLVLDNYTDSVELNNLAQKLVDIFENPFEGISEHQYVNAEIAIVEIEQEDLTADRVLQDASLALSHLHNKSNSNIKFYNGELETKIQREDKIERALRSIVQGKGIDSFYLEFHPKLDIKKNRIVGFEALARMHVKGIGLISPIEFIPIAEKELLIYDLGNEILIRSCEFINKLKKQGHDDISVAVNISGIQLLREEFIDSIRKIANLTSCDMKSLEFEITESVLLDNFDLINEKLEDIKQMGISISLDDFGTGFSSLARLRELNINAVKIDKYFINKLDAENEDDLITADIISMSHKIGLSVVAEGVENEKQKKYLEKHNCDIIQGYLLSKPVPGLEAIELLKNNNKQMK